VTKGEDTRRTALSAALELASSDGLAGVTIGRLADHVGMSKSGLFAHFQSKEGLDIEILRAAIDRFTATVISPALKAQRGEPRVTTLFEGWLGWPEQFSGGCIFVAAAVELDDQPGPVREVLVSCQRDWVDTLAHATQIAVQQGHFRPDLDVRQLAHELYCLGLGHHMASRLLADPDGDARTRTSFERILRFARNPS
jgi:AcrR family transcriptional regulator